MLCRLGTRGCRLVVALARHTSTARVDKEVAVAAMMHSQQQVTQQQVTQQQAHIRPENALDYLTDDGPYPRFVYDALGEKFSQAELGRLLMSMAK